MAGLVLLPVTGLEAVMMVEEGRRHVLEAIVVFEMKERSGSSSLIPALVDAEGAWEAVGPAVLLEYTAILAWIAEVGEATLPAAVVENFEDE